MGQWGVFSEGASNSKTSGNTCNTNNSWWGNCEQVGINYRPVTWCSEGQVQVINNYWIVNTAEVPGFGKMFRSLKKASAVWKHLLGTRNNKEPQDMEINWAQAGLTRNNDTKSKDKHKEHDITWGLQRGPAHKIFKRCFHTEVPQHGPWL